MEVSAVKLVSVRANKEHFRPVEFRDGLNVILAERTDESKDTDSRNGVGKTTLFQIIDFCLGGRVKSSDGLSKLTGSGWEFELTLEFENESRLAVTRSLDETSDIRLSGDLVALGLAEKSPTRLGVRGWTSWLGERAFGLNDREIKSEYEPTFRRLFGHFLRFRADAYISPFETFGKQPPHQVQVDNAYLMGLNSALAVEWQRLKDRDKALGALAKRDVDEIGERLGDLESRRVRVESNRRRLVEQIEKFEVLPEYREVELRANKATARMQKLANESTMSGRLLDLYREQLASEEPSELEAVIEVFEEAGVVFGNALERSLEEIIAFHAQVARNRLDYLRAEVAKLESIQLERHEELMRLEASRRADLAMLESHGALEDFAQLQQRVGTAAAEAESLSQQIDELRRIRAGKAALRVEQVELQQRTALDIEERLDSVAAVLEDFSETFESLYGEPADLVIDSGPAGYQFRVALPRQGSHGVGKVGVFAYDIAVANVWAKRQAGPGFLAHDSIIFDGVYERQVASAIRRAKDFADQLGYQYILTVNSDDLPAEQLDAYGVGVADVVVITLTDTDAAGGLLGVRV